MAPLTKIAVRDACDRFTVTAEDISLADILAAVAAAGSTHTPKVVTGEDMKLGIAVAMRAKHGRS
jgi:hypothetical protein